jgi:hypothetical protein
MEKKREGGINWPLAGSGIPPIGARGLPADLLHASLDETYAAMNLAWQKRSRPRP